MTAESDRATGTGTGTDHSVPLTAAPAPAAAQRQGTARRRLPVACDVVRAVSGTYCKGAAAMAQPSIGLHFAGRSVHQEE
jgi:hypothetical protein